MSKPQYLFTCIEILELDFITKCEKKNKPSRRKRIMSLLL